MPVSIPMRIVMGTEILKEGENIGELGTAMNILPPRVENSHTNLLSMVTAVKEMPYHLMGTLRMFQK